MKPSFLSRKAWFAPIVPVLLALSLAGLPGCSQSTEGIVSGKVTFNGTPVAGAHLTLYPVDGGTAAATINTSPEGTFTGVKVPPGEYKVTAESMHQGSPLPAFMKSGKTPSPQERFNLPEEQKKMFAGANVTIPAKYADPKQTILTWTIQIGKNDSRDFDLTD
jgi:hypothetical protein